MKVKLEFSRVATKAKELELTDSELILNQALSNLDLYIKQNKTTITHDPLPEVIADSTQLVHRFLIIDIISYNNPTRNLVFFF